MNRTTVGTISLFLLFYLFVHISYPQDPNYQIDLFKDNISWNWQGKFNWGKRISPHNNLYFKNFFNSNLFHESGIENKWKDENNLEGGWTKQFSTSFGSSILFRSHIFSDENSFIKFSKHLLVEEIQLNPLKKLNINPALGVAAEEMYNFHDQGWYAQINAKTEDLNLGGYLSNSEFLNSVYFYPGRRNQEHRYFISFFKKFSDFAIDSLRIGYEFMKNSYHLALVDYLENVEINSRFLYNLLKYRLNNNINFNIETKIQSRDISQSNLELLNHRNEVNLANKVSFILGTASFKQEISFFASQNTNLSSRSVVSREESRNDLEGKQAAFNIFSHWQIDPNNEFRLSFAYTKYESSSPDTTMIIDEDDLRFITNVEYQHRFNKYLSTRFSTYLYLFHQIYIHSSRTANNNWNRIFQIGPSVNLEIPGVLEHTNRFKILANYTVYDFDEILPQIRSYVFRKMIFTDSLSLHLSNRLTLQTRYQIEKEDDGTFIKNLFAQQVSRELFSQFLDILLVYTRIEGIELATGLNWYFRKEWILYPSRRIVRDRRAFSPRLTILYHLGPRLMLHFSFSPRTYRDINLERQYYSTGRINLKYYF